METAASPVKPGFVQSLGLLSSTSIVVGSMIGSGIFIVSAKISRLVGSPGLLLLVWLITGLMTLMAALSYSELAAMLPKAGGQYVYLREAMGPVFGFLYGWTFFVVMQTGTIAAVAIAFAKYLGELVPWVSERHWLFYLGHLGPMPLGINTEECAAIAVIALLTAINVRGVKSGALVQNIFTTAKVLGLLGLILLGLFFARNHAAITANFHHLWQGAAGPHPYPTAKGVLWLSTPAIIFLAMVGSLFSSDSWYNIAFAAGEVKNPRRTLPWALTLGTALVTSLYILANFAYLFVLPMHGSAAAATVIGRGIQHATEDRVATAMVSISLGHAGAMVMALAILVSTFGCDNGLILAGARVTYAMARDGLFFRRAGELHPRHRTPAWSLWAQGLWACLLCLSGTYNQLLEYVMFAVVLFYILTIACVFILRRRRPEWPRPYRALGYPWLPGLYIALAGFFDWQLLRYMPGYAYPGLILVLLGLPVYWLWNRRPRIPEGNDPLTEPL